MRNLVRAFLAFCIGLALALPLGADDLPDYFLLSFLDLSEDMQEAQDQNKHLLLYFHQEGCPYCLAMESRVFPNAEVDALLREQFLAISLNIWGDRVVTLADGSEISEKALARRLAVQFTPTILLLRNARLDKAGLMGRINGYRKPQAFIQTVNSALGRLGSQPDQGPLANSRYKFAGLEELAQPDPNKPIALFFEHGNCDDCQHLHNLLAGAEARQLLQKYQVFRLHAASEDTLSYAGKATTPSMLAQAFRIGYYPTVVLLSSEQNGTYTERLRIDSHIKEFHFVTALDYVAQKIYTQDDNFQNYINARSNVMRERGVDVRIWK